MFRKFLLSPYSKSCRTHILLRKSLATLPKHKHMHLLSSKTLLLPSDCPKSSRIYDSPKHFSPIYQSCTPYSAICTPIDGVDVGTLEKQLVDQKQLMILKQKLQEKGIDGSKCVPGKHSGLICPSCKGGASHEKSLSLIISKDGGAAKWTCYRASCGWSGKTRAFAHATKSKIKKAKKAIRVIDEESLELEPLGNELLAYFAERMISEETLRRNGVMQKKNGPFKVAIAFPYRRNGELVSCKYRDTKKRFWQEASTESIFYGLDDIKGASDVIIVEGEMDKLAMEEAGFKNCISVPHGAPPKFSNKELPSQEEDTRYIYIWNCRDYLDKASRIILATDGDKPGRALAEELARRVGKERCWLVKWPKKDRVSSCNDANEVLKNFGADGVRDAIDNAKPYQMQNVD